MDCNDFHPDRILEVEVNTVSIDGDITDSWADSTTDCRAEMIFAGGDESAELGGPVYRERRRYKVRKENRSWTPDSTRFKESTDTNFFYMTAFYPYRTKDKSSRLIYVMEGIQRDDE